MQPVRHAVGEHGDRELRADERGGRDRQRQRPDSATVAGGDRTGDRQSRPVGDRAGAGESCQRERLAVEVERRAGLHDDGICRGQGVVHAELQGSGLDGGRPVVAVRGRERERASAALDKPAIDRRAAVERLLRVDVEPVAVDDCATFADLETDALAPVRVCRAEEVRARAFGDQRTAPEVDASARGGRCGVVIEAVEAERAADVEVDRRLVVSAVELRHAQFGHVEYAAAGHSGAGACAVGVEDLGEAREIHEAVGDGQRPVLCDPARAGRLQQAAPDLDGAAVVVERVGELVLALDGAAGHDRGAADDPQRARIVLQGVKRVRAPRAGIEDERAGTSSRPRARGARHGGLQHCRPRGDRRIAVHGQRTAGDDVAVRREGKISERHRADADRLLAGARVREHGVVVGGVDPRADRRTVPPVRVRGVPGGGGGGLQPRIGPRRRGSRRGQRDGQESRRELGDEAMPGCLHVWHPIGW